LAEAWRALLLLSGNVTEDRFWSESWTSADRVLTLLADWLRRSRAVRTIEIDEGWSDDRDVSVFVDRWAWLDVRALVEEHGSGKSLVRISMHLRPTTFGIVAAVGLGAVLLAGAATGAALRRPLAGSIVSALAVLARLAEPLALRALASSDVRHGGGEAAGDMSVSQLERVVEADRERAGVVGCPPAGRVGAGEMEDEVAERGHDVVVPWLVAPEERQHGSWV